MSYIHGALYISNNVAPTTLLVTETFYSIQTGWVAGFTSGTTLDAAAGTIVSTVTGKFTIICSLTINTIADTLQFQVFKNGVPLPGCTEVRTAGPNAATYIYPITISGVVSLQANIDV